MVTSFLKRVRCIPAWLVYKYSSNNIVRDELRCWRKSLRIEFRSEYKSFLFLMTLPEYRSELYWRLGAKARFIKIIYPPHSTLYISTASNNVGKGFVIEHGHSTIIHASSIGENCHVWQNVTIGKQWPGGNKPVIGKNVFVCTGAVVLGDIIVGDNVIIGANAVVTKSIPNNCTVAGNPAMIIKRDGKRVTEKL